MVNTQHPYCVDLPNLWWMEARLGASYARASENAQTNNDSLCHQYLDHTGNTIMQYFLCTHKSGDIQMQILELN